MTAKDTMESNHVNCPNCGAEIEIAPSEFRYGKVSHNRKCGVWVHIDRWEGVVVGVEEK